MNSISKIVTISPKYSLSIAIIYIYYRNQCAYEMNKDRIIFCEECIFYWSAIFISIQYISYIINEVSFHRGLYCCCHLYACAVSTWKYKPTETKRIKTFQMYCFLSCALVCFTRSFAIYFTESFSFILFLVRVCVCENNSNISSLWVHRVCGSATK